MSRSEGMELMRQLSDGSLKLAPSAELMKVRDRVTEACGGLLDIGPASARCTPARSRWEGCRASTCVLHDLNERAAVVLPKRGDHINLGCCRVITTIFVCFFLILARCWVLTQHGHIRNTEFEGSPQHQAVCRPAGSYRWRCPSVCGCREVMPPPEQITVMRESFVTDDDIAAFLKIEHRQVLEMTRKGIIPAHPLDPAARRKVWRYKITEVDDAMAIGNRKPLPPRSNVALPGRTRRVQCQSAVPAATGETPNG